MKRKPKFQSRHNARILRAAVLGALLVGAQAQAASPFPQTPLGITSATSIAPNIMFLLDDSGSMQWEWIGNGSPNLQIFTYGYPLGFSKPYGSGTYGDQAPGFEAGNIYAAQFRSAYVNPVYYNPAITYYPWACAAPYPESPNSTTGVTAPQTNLQCVWNSTMNLWLMQDANPSQTYLNPADQGAGWRDLTVWNDSNNANNNGNGNGFIGSSNANTNWLISDQGNYYWWTGRYPASFDTDGNPYYWGFWPATYFNYIGPQPAAQSDLNNISNFQRVQICPATTPNTPYQATTTNANNQTTTITACTTPPPLPGSPAPYNTYMDGSGNYVYITGAGKQIVRTYSQEMQNFANWYQYDRSHIGMARAGTSQAFMQLPTNFRVDFATINGITQGGGNPKYSTIHRFQQGNGSAERQNFLNYLFQQPIPTAGTPSRLALAAVGKWLSQGPLFSAPWGPTTQERQEYGNTIFSCRQNYTVFVTDGGWNGSGPNLGNVDNQTGPTITGPGNQSYTYQPANPYKDSVSNTLADVAQYYWEHDLQTGLTNNVPTNPSDPAFWQHMVTFSVGLGVEGAFRPGCTVNNSLSHCTQIANYSYNSQSNTVNNWIQCPTVCSEANIWSALQQGYISWPNPVNNNSGGNNPATIDDLWHAAVDGHGTYLSASNPQAYASALSNTLQNIQTRTQSTSSVAVTGTQLAQNSIAYVPSYTSGVWTGDVQAYLYNPNTGKFNTTAAWSAQTNISAQGGSSRNIFTMGSSGAVAFQPSNLSTTQSTALTNPAYVSGATLSQVVANISGNTSQDGILFRNRNGQVLGDIIDASPQYVGAPNLYYTFPGYGQFAAANASRIPVLYTPANDGMLHAIDACAASYPSGVTPPAGCTSGTAQQNAGKELWAYIPNAVIPYLDQRISLSNFSHQYLMDSTPTIGDFCTGGSGTGNSGTCTAWESLLVASEGRGVSGIYALNVTNPQPSASQLSPWEITPSTTGFSAMGYVISQPLLVKTQSMGWVVVFGSGYQTTPTSTGNGYLYFVNPNTGALLTTLTLPNQVSGSQLSVAGIAAASFNSPGYAQALYVTDNEGDVWKVKLPANASPPQGTQSPSSAPTLGYNGGPMFVATDSSGNRQPISTTPVVSQDTQGRIGVMFGTGQWLFSSDTTDNLTQSLYGVWDVNQTYPGTLTTPITRANLVQQTLSTTTGTNTTGGTTYSTRTSTSNPVTYSSAPGGKKGWYIDLPITGERVIVNPLLVFGDVIFTSYVPGATSTDPCTSSNGTSWITAVNYLTGAVPSTNPFGFTGTAASVVSIQVAGQAPQPTVTSSPNGLQLLLPGAGGGTTPQSINFFPPFNGGAATRAWTQR
ncbi:MAG: pilus assembly protein [Acidithiobacillus sp.]